MKNILEKITADKRIFIETRKKQKNLTKLQDEIKNLNPTKDLFYEAINQSLTSQKIAYICEIKKASPSLGDINTEINITEQARKYLANGATCLSVLTDEKYFKGKDDDLKEAKRAVDIPILRKDFIIDPYQIYESKALGADAILLIMACLSKNQALEFEEIAYSLGLSVLTESHDESELVQALSLKSPLIGINNRNLKTMEISLNNTKKLAKLVPENKIIISESGIKSKKDIEDLSKVGAKGFLIGTSLMQDNISIK